MQFRIADTFTDSLAKLTGDEQKAVKTAAFDLQMNPAHPGLKLHQVDRAKDKDFWSVRVSRDIRLIVYRTASSVLLCYVDHHDAAYQWAERRRLEQHPRTGAAQLVEIRETVREIQVPRYVEVDVSHVHPGRRGWQTGGVADRDLRRRLGRRSARLRRALRVAGRRADRDGGHPARPRRSSAGRGRRRAAAACDRRCP